MKPQIMEKERFKLILTPMLVTWGVDKETQEYSRWVRRIFAYMAPDVSKSLRALCTSKYLGFEAFKYNFKRLVHAKTVIDPGNFFSNKQNIPVFPSGGEMNGN
ncbi:cannabidiolic acid synthase [Quercus suber]|uniref:Cannabidiolic acid synthase n=1 Tax=Quercus suber TaxID=58331 RepID=A0AAW0ISI5_QUESU